MDINCENDIDLYIIYRFFVLNVQLERIIREHYWYAAGVNLNLDFSPIIERCQELKKDPSPLLELYDFEDYPEDQIQKGLQTIIDNLH